MTKELLEKQKNILNNITEIQQHHTEFLNQHLNPPTLENSAKKIPPKTAFVTPNIIYEKKIQESFEHRQHKPPKKE